MSQAAAYEINAGSANCAARHILFVIALCYLLLPATSRAGQLPGDRWDLLAISYPPGREVEVALGGGGKSLAASGACTVKAKKDKSSLEIEIRDLPSVAEVGWTGRQYVL